MKATDRKHLIQMQKLLAKVHDHFQKLSLEQRSPYEDEKGYTDETGVDDLEMFILEANKTIADKLSM